MALGQPNPYAMLAQMPYRVFRQWQQFYNEEPFGDEANGVRLGYAAASLGTLLGKPKGRRAWKTSDFMPQFKTTRTKRARPKETPEQQFERIKLMTLMMGGKVIDKRRKEDDGDD
jgi:hypothetical protein